MILQSYSLSTEKALSPNIKNLNQYRSIMHWRGKQSKLALLRVYRQYNNYPIISILSCSRQCSFTLCNRRTHPNSELSNVHLLSSELLMAVSFVFALLCFESFVEIGNSKLDNAFDTQMLFKLFTHRQQRLNVLSGSNLLKTESNIQLFEQSVKHKKSQLEMHKNGTILHNRNTHTDSQSH